METRFDKQQTALFLAPVYPAYNSEAHQNDIALWDDMPLDEKINRLTLLHEDANGVDSVMGTMPDGTIVEIGDAPRRPIPPTN